MMKSNKVTADMLKQLIHQVMDEMGITDTAPLPAEPPADNPTAEPPTGIETITETKKSTDPVGLAIGLIMKLDDEQQQKVFRRFGRQTYDEFLHALAKYERAKKPK